MIDRFISQFDKALRTVVAPAYSVRELPGHQLPEAEMSAEERAHAGALMRINHSGEVCAQALYQGQAMTSKDPEIRRSLEYASFEEIEHLAWTEQRIRELQTHRSLLNPIWYIGSLGLGILAGKFGDAWNLGFLAETEHQVSAHLRHHLTILPQQDARSRAVVTQMEEDERHHAQTALDLGGRELPVGVKWAMKKASRVFTALTYRL